MQFDETNRLDDERMWQTLARFAAGECSAQEEAELRAWASSNPVHREMLDSAVAAWEMGSSPERRERTRAAWERVHERMTEAPAVVPRRMRSMMRGLYAREENRAASSKGVGRPVVRQALAATVAGAMLVGAAALGALLGRSGAAEPIAMEELITEKGERAEVRLADGTRVVLGPESRLQIPRRAGSRTREVRLMGEGYFDVTHDADRPFLVIAGNTVTRVLGTEFDVRAYPADSVVEVVVAEGRVTLRATRAPEEAAIALAPGDLGSVAAGADSVSVRSVDPEGFSGWQQGRLAFDDAPLSLVAAQLERWYGIPVRIGDPALRHRRLTASFRDQSADEVISLIAAALEVKFSKVGQAYTFLPKDRPSSLARG